MLGCQHSQILFGPRFLTNEWSKKAVSGLFFRRLRSTIQAPNNHPVWGGVGGGGFINQDTRLRPFAEIQIRQIFKVNEDTFDSTFDHFL